MKAEMVEHNIIGAFREKLCRKHLGMTQEEELPLEGSLLARWQAIAAQNTEAYQRCFDWLPYNMKLTTATGWCRAQEKSKARWDAAKQVVI